LRPDSGTAYVDEFDIQQQRVAAQKQLGVLPDKRGIYQRLTTRENIAYYGRLHGLNGGALQARIDYLIDLLDMGDIANRKTEGFSTGQKVKVAIARSLVHHPSNVMLDEPTQGLDVMSTRAMRQVIRQLRQEGHTVLFSSHIMQEVASLCDNIVVIAHGQVVAQGSPDALRQQTGKADLEDAFVSIIGSEEGLK
jgi:sodium transport system ATP-binding protein